MKRVLLLGLIATVILAGCSKPAKTGAAGANAEAMGPFDTPFSAFKSAFEAKDYGKALAGLRSLMGTFWAESPLVLENPKFVKGENNSYGIYEPRENDVFTAYSDDSGHPFRTKAATCRSGATLGMFYVPEWPG